MLWHDCMWKKKRCCTWHVQWNLPLKLEYVILCLRNIDEVIFAFEKYFSYIFVILPLSNIEVRYMPICYFSHYCSEEFILSLMLLYWEYKFKFQIFMWCYCTFLGVRVYTSKTKEKGCNNRIVMFGMWFHTDRFECYTWVPCSRADRDITCYVICEVQLFNKSVSSYNCFNRPFCAWRQEWYMVAAEITFK